MKLPRPPYIGGSEDGWMGYWGSLIGSAIGLIGAFSVMRMQLISEKKERDEGKKPVLVLGNAQYKEAIAESFRDPVFPISKVISIPLINGGQTPVFNLKITYFLKNDVIQGINTTKYKKTVETNSKTGRGYIILKRKDRDIVYLNLDEGTGKSYSVIMPGATLELIIPQQHTEMLLFYYESLLLDYTMEKNSLTHFLTMEIEFKDYKMELNKLKFDIKTGLIYSQNNKENEILDLAFLIETQIL